MAIKKYNVTQTFQQLQADLNKIEAMPAPEQVATKAVNDLLYYYLKSETYTKAEVEQMLSALASGAFVPVPALPEPSAETFGMKIYLVPTPDPKVQNIKDEFITVRSGEEGAYTYAWEQIGSTAIDLSGYATDEELSQLEHKVDGNYDYVEQDVEYFPGYIKNTDPVIPDYNPLAGTYSAIFNVEEGDKFKLYGTGGSSLLPMYIITDVAFSVLDLFYDSNTHRNPPKEVTIPVNGRYLLVNLYNFVTGDKVEKYVKIEGLADKLDAVSANIERIDGELDGTKKFADLITTISANTYYPTANAVINPDSPGSLTGSSTTKVECKEGDVFRIFGYGKTGATQQYAFVDSSKNNILTPKIAILSRSDGNVVTAPTNAAYLLINFISYDSTTDKVQSLVVDDEGFIESVNDRFNGAYGVGENKDGFLLNHYFNTASKQPVFRGTADYYEGVSCQCVPCKPGDEFKIFGKGNAAVLQLYAFVDKNNNWLYRPVTAIDAKANGLVVTAPSDSAFLVVNYLDYDATTDKLLSTINTVQSVSDIAKKSLIGKKIVLFGDSITQNKYNGKGWSDYASEITGAEFINCAIGGTQIKSRVPLITLFDSTIQYEVGDRVYYKPDSSMRCYVFNNSHLGAWDANDCEEVTDSKIYATLDMCNLVAASCDTVTPIEHRFDNVLAAAECCHDILGTNGLTPIISRLISIDWTTIDAVILMGGVNDYGTGHLGASGGTDRTTTLGAINDIVANLCGTYKAIPFYYVSPVVQWTGFPNTQTPATWCDVYVKNYETITLKQYAEAILNEVKENHISGFDIYNLIGWNMNNFSEFYTNDGTHPLRGFKQIAYKIAGFLQTNKAF